jgi:DNA topoisomerase-1
MKIIRVGTYKTGFKYYKNKVEITNADEIEKIRLLKIPPAYENVTILNNKKIIAFGYDSKNRKQVLYHPAFIAKQNVKKYNKMTGSINFFSKLKRKVATDLKSSGGDEKTMAIAVIITLILKCGFRIGNKKYEKDNNSVGLTTLKYKHLKFENKKVLIDFIGKKGVRNVATCDDRIIYEYLHKAVAAEAAADSTDYVFTYDNGRVITSSDVNEYLKVISKRYSGDIHITTKDLRTWNANTLFLEYYKKLRKIRSRGNKGNKGNKGMEGTPGDARDAPEEAGDAERTARYMKDIHKDIKRAIEMVAEKLHNTYSICKKSYIDPKIIEGVISNGK